MQLPSLYAIANVDTLSSPLDYIKKLIDADVKLIQLRAKNVSKKDFLSLAVKSIELANKKHTKIIINDDIQVCLETNSHGIHLGQTDICPIEARKRLGGKRIIGLSTHTIDHIKLAPLAALNYLALGPIFKSPTKQGHAEIVGVKTLALAVKISPLPLVAIGGINTINAKEVYQAGASSIAAISDLEKATNLKLQVEKYLEAFNSNA
jgi:thiamine-phosphate pyrophosphorylase